MSHASDPIVGDVGQRLILTVPDATVTAIGSLIASESFNSQQFTSLEGKIRDITSHKEVEERFRNLVKVKRLPVKQLTASPSLQKYYYYVARRGKQSRGYQSQSVISPSPAHVAKIDANVASTMNDEAKSYDDYKSTSSSCQLNVCKSRRDILLSVIDQVTFVSVRYDDNGQRVIDTVNDDDLTCKQNAIYTSLQCILSECDVALDSESNCLTDITHHNQLDTYSDNFVRTVILGALDTYYKSIKLSIIRYLVRCKQTAKCVGLPVTREEEDEANDLSEGCCIITPTVPWHTSVRHSYIACDTNLLTTTSLIQNIRISWYEHFSLNKLDAFALISFPCNVQYFTSRISINLSLIKATLTYEWVSSVASMYNDYIIAQRVTDERKRSQLCDVIYIFMSRLLRQFIMQTIEIWVNIVTNRNIDRLECELFVARADYLKDTGCHLDPSPDAWQWLLQFPIRQVLASFKRIPRIECQLTTLPDDIYFANSSKFLLPVDEENDWQANTLLDVMNTSTISQLPGHSILHSLDESIKQIQAFKEKCLLTYDIDKFRAIIADQLIIERQLISPHERDRSTHNSGLVLVNFNELKRKILLEAQSTREWVTKVKVSNVINLGHELCSSLNDIKVKIEAVTESTEEIVNSIKSMNDYRMLVRCIFKDIEYIEAHWHFLTQEGAIFLSDTDYELMHNLYNWPAIMRITFATVDARLGASKARKEARLRDRIHSFNVFLDQLISELIHFNKKRLSSPLEKISDNVKSLEEMEETIEQAMRTKIEINFEEGLLGWPIQTKFPQLDILRSFKYPIDLLWRTADEFDVKCNKWLNLRIKDVDIPRISQNIKRMKERVKCMQNSLLEAIDQNKGEIEGTEEVKSSIQLLESKVREFEEIQIPLLTVLTMPELREKHLAEVTNVLESDDLTFNNLTTLTDISKLRIDIDKVAQIQDIGRNALREHELEVFLSRMKNEWISDDEWPSDALNIAASKFLEEESLSQSVKEQCVLIFKAIHDCARKFVSGGAASDKRSKTHDLLPPFRLHFTPPSFVEFILTFKELLRKKQTQIYNRKHRYKGGVEKLEMAASFVLHMKRKLIEEDNPKLERMSSETEKLMVTIEEETIQVEWTKERIACDEGLANAAAALAQQIRDECTKELASAVPAVESAIKALDTIVPEDIVFLRTMKNPPLGLKMVLESVAVLLAYPPEKKTNSNGLQYDDYWSSALKMLNSSEVTLLEALKTFDKDHVDPQFMTLLRQSYLCYDDFDPMALRNVSIASESLAKWVKAIDIYDRVINVIKPKKAKLLQAEQELISLVDKVYTKKTELQVITDKLQGLSDRFAAVSKEKKELEENIIESGLKLERAEKLLTGLQVERKRWAQASEQLTVLEKTLIGDAILSAGFIVYLSGIPAFGRQLLLRMWHDFISENTEIKCSTPFKLSEAAATQLEIQTWIVAGLPIEQFYLDNATILSNSRRYCFIVDPYEIATDFIKKYHTVKGLTLITSNDSLTPTIYIQIRKNITRGKPVVMEDVSRDKLLDPFIQSILIKDIDESTSGSAYITLQPSQEELEYDKNFNFYMICKEYFELPRDIYSRICIINWIDESFNSLERKANLEQAIEYQERAKKERQLIELEDKLLEKLAYGLNTLDNEDAISLLVKYKNLALQLHDEQESPGREAHDARPSFLDAGVITR